MTKSLNILEKFNYLNVEDEAKKKVSRELLK